MHTRTTTRPDTDQGIANYSLTGFIPNFTADIKFLLKKFFSPDFLLN